MTNKEAIFNLNHIYGIVSPDIQRSIDLAIKALEEKPIIKCKDCKYQVKEWREDKRMKEKGYWVCGCEHFGELMGYWGFGGNDNEFCSDADLKGGAE